MRANARRRPLHCQVASSVAISGLVAWTLNSNAVQPAATHVWQE
jgi:hypothetical protein